jgi:hypothetical protein
MSHDLTAMQLAEAHTLHTTQKWSQKALALRYGVSPATLCRLMQRVTIQGAEAAAVKGYATGTREDEHALTSDEQARLKLGMLTKRSRRLAAQLLMSWHKCEQVTFEILSRVVDAAADKAAEPVWPEWFRRACIVTDEERLSFSGPKALMRIEPARPRGRFYIEHTLDGREIQHPLFPGALWKSDDQSENTPSVTVDAVTGEAQVNRQTLYTVDSDAAYLLGFSSISRIKDTYTLEDQADHVNELVDAHGMPLAWMIEGGPWNNDFWWGVKMPKDWWQTPECPKYRFGGIHVEAGGPIRVIRAFKSRHKAEIEGAFNHLQNLNADTSLDIGRYRGEFEAAAKKLSQVQTLRTPERIARAAAAFPTQKERADLTAEVTRKFNSEAKCRKIHGRQRIVPAELWAQAQTRPVTDDIRWRFLPVKKALTVKNAHIFCRLEQHKGREFMFTAEGFQPTWDWHAYLPSGWRVFAVFHPHRLDLGCRIFNAVHPKHAKNPARFPMGMPLGVLPLAELAPQWREGEGVKGGDFAGRREWHKQVQRETRIIKAARSNSTTASFTAAKSGKASSARKGSPDPLNKLPAAVTSLDDLDHGAPPVTDLSNLSLERGGDPRSAQASAGQGADDRGHPISPAARVSGHEASRHAQGSISAAEAARVRLAELEASLD